MGRLCIFFTLITEVEVVSKGLPGCIFVCNNMSYCVSCIMLELNQAFSQGAKFCISLNKRYCLTH